MFDDSDIFTISDCPGGGIRVSSPDTGDSLERGKGHIIRWAVSLENRVANPKVEIWFYDSDGILKILSIANETDNDGSHNWLIPGNVSPGVYRIRVRTINNQTCDSSAIFNIRIGK